MSETNTTPVVIRQLRKSFGAQVVLAGIDLTVKRGETLAVLGQSGTGKSVLLKLIIGLLRADSGSIDVEGERIDPADRARLNAIRKRIGFLFQQAALYDSLSVAENVDFPLLRHTKLAPADRAKRVRELLAIVGMERDADKSPSQLSGGMQKRVGLARALALDPEIVLFDEPTAGLDPITADGIDKLMIRLKQERRITSIVVTHDIHGVRSFADRVVMLREGRIAMDGTFADLERSKDEFLARFLKSAA